MLVRGLWLDMDLFGGMFCILACGLSRAIGPLLVSCYSELTGGLSVMSDRVGRGRVFPNSEDGE